VLKLHCQETDKRSYAVHFTGRLTQLHKCINYSEINSRMVFATFAVLKYSCTNRKQLNMQRVICFILQLNRDILWSDRTIIFMVDFCCLTDLTDYVCFLSDLPTLSVSRLYRFDDRVINDMVQFLECE
jgi:hypothetical protein